MGVRSTPPDSLSGFVGTLVGGATTNIADKVGDVSGSIVNNFLDLPGYKSEYITKELPKIAPVVMNQFMNFGDRVFAGKSVNRRTGEPTYERPSSESISNVGWTSSLIGMEPTEFTNERQRNMLEKVIELKKTNSKNRNYTMLADAYMQAQKSGKLENPAATNSVLEMLQSSELGADQGDIVNNIANRVMSQSSSARNTPSISQLDTWKQADELVPGASTRQVQNPVSEFLLKLRIAQTLGLSRYLATTAPQIAQSLLRAGQESSLLQMGLTPEMLQRLKAGGNSQDLLPSGDPLWKIAPLTQP